MEIFNGVHATRYTVVGLIPDEVIGVFIYLNFPAALGSWVWLGLKQKWVPGLPPGG